MSKTILLADDSVTIQKVIELTFMDQEHRVTAVSSGDEALSRLAADKPDFVIADVHMPGASGYSVARRSKDLYPEVPVLLLVGTFEAFDEAEAEASGADNVLKKPFDSQELLRLVDELSAAAESVVAETESPVAAQVENTRVENTVPEAAEESPSAEPKPFDWKEDTAPAISFEGAVAPPATETPRETAAEAPAEDPFPDLSPPEAVAEPEGSLLDTFAPAFPSSQPAEPVFEATPEPAEPVEEPLAEVVAEAWQAPPVVEESFEEPTLVAEAVEEVALELDEPTSEPEEAAAEAVVETASAVAASPALAWEGSEEEAEATPASTEEEAVVEEVAAPVSEAPGTFSDEDIERIARRVAELVGEQLVRRVAWEVVPDLAEVIIRDRLNELESQVE